MRLGSIFLAFALMSAAAMSATVYVPDDHATIQGAISAVSAGDTIIVRSGTYVESLNFLGKAVTVTSEKGPAVTVIDGNRARAVAEFASSEGPDSVLEGFTICNGEGLLGWMTYPPNQTIIGGGVFCDGASLTIAGNVIVDNIGSGITSFSSSPSITGNVVARNDAVCGGGFSLFDSSALIANNLIYTNTATYGGGAIWCMGQLATPLITNCTIHGNQASAYGGGLYAHTDATPIIENTILWSNQAPSGPEVALLNWDTPTAVTISYCDLQDGQSACFVDSSCMLNWGAGNIDASPLFAAPFDEDLHLTWNSPCRDAGDSSAVTELTDFEGDPRVALSTVDIGADEYYYHLYHMGDVIPGSPIEVKAVGYPTAPVTLFLGSGIADPPYATQHGDFWLAWPPLWQGNIGTVPADGIMVLSATVPTGWIPGSDHPFQALVGPWGDAYTRFTNPMVLTVE